MQFNEIKRLNCSYVSAWRSWFTFAQTKTNSTLNSYKFKIKEDAILEDWPCCRNLLSLFLLLCSYTSYLCKFPHSSKIQLQKWLMLLLFKKGNYFRDAEKEVLGENEQGEQKALLQHNYFIRTRECYLMLKNRPKAVVQNQPRAVGCTFSK